MACFGNAFHTVTIIAKGRFGNRNHMPLPESLAILPRCRRSCPAASNVQHRGPMLLKVIDEHDVAVGGLNL